MTNSSSTTTPTIEARFQFFPLAWAPGVARQVFETLVGPNNLYPSQAWGNEGGDSLPGDPGELIDVLTDRYEASHRGNRITLFTAEPFSVYNFELFRSEWDDDAKIGQLMFWAKQLRLSVAAHAATDGALQALTHVAAITHAPLVSFDYRPSTRFEPITLASQRELKRVVQGTVHANASAGPWCGLHRIPWRLLLGADIVATIGADRLASLPSDQAIDHGNGQWTLQTTLDPAESITELGRDAERKIIETLGSEFFADTATNRLAETPPTFPEAVMPRHDLLFERYGEQLKPL